MDGNQITTRSLKQDLNRWLIAITLCLSTVAGVVAGVVAFFEARDIQDEILIQFAGLVNENFITNSVAQHDLHDDSKVVIQPVLANKPLEIDSDIANGFSTIDGREGPWRVYIISRTEQGAVVRYAVAQNTELRDEIAYANTISAVLPIVVLAFVLLIVINWIIISRMKPIVQLATKIDQYSADDLQPLPMKNIPAEVLPFIGAINRLLLRTTDMMSKQKRFIADASHELRTPVAALSLQSENLQNSENSEDYQQRFGLLREGLDRLNKLVNQLLNLARLQNTSSDKFELVQIKAVVEDVIVYLLPLAENKNLDLGVVQQSDDYLQDQNGGLKQIVENSIANAIYYSPVNGQIDVAITREKDNVIFTVLDDGPGIADHALEKVFEPFYRADEQSYVGNGLGLSICAEIAKRLGGQIKLENRTRGGLRFSYTQLAHK